MFTDSLPLFTQIYSYAHGQNHKKNKPKSRFEKSYFIPAYRIAIRNVQLQTQKVRNEQIGNVPTNYKSRVERQNNRNKIIHFKNQIK